MISDTDWKNLATEEFGISRTQHCSWKRSYYEAKTFSEHFNALIGELIVKPLQKKVDEVHDPYQFFHPTIFDGTIKWTKREYGIKMLVKEALNSSKCLQLYTSQVIKGLYQSYNYIFDIDREVVEFDLLKPLFDTYVKIHGKITSSFLLNIYFGYEKPVYCCHIETWPFVNITSTKVVQVIYRLKQFLIENNLFEYDYSWDYTLYPELPVTLYFIDTNIERKYYIGPYDYELVSKQMWFFVEYYEEIDW